MDAIDEDPDDPDVYMDDPDVYMEAPSTDPSAENTKKSDAATKQPKVDVAEDTENEHQSTWAGTSKLAQQDGEVAMLRGNSLLLRGEYEEAEEAFNRAIQLEPTLEEAHVGKVNALRKQRKYIRAFTTCRQGLERIKSETLQQLMDKVQKEYQANKKREAEKKKKAAEDTARFVEEKMREEMDNGCPGSTFKVELDRQAIANATDEERDECKLQLLTVYRDLYNKLGSYSTAEAVKQSTSSYSSTDKLGLKISEGHRPMPRPTDVIRPPDYRRSVGNIKLEVLSQYNCNTPRLLVSVYGDIFDVSDRPDKYGKDGPYHYFSGCDITWGLASGRDDEHNVNKFYDVWKSPTAEERDKKLQCLCSWVGFFEKEYGEPVGRLEVFDNERNLPPPPTTDDCCVM